jgi:hypothetical protein
LAKDASGVRRPVNGMTLLKSVSAEESWIMKARQAGLVTRRSMALEKTQQAKAERQCATYIVHANVKCAMWLNNKRTYSQNSRSPK